MRGIFLKIKLYWQIVDFVLDKLDESFVKR